MPVLGAFHRYGEGCGEFELRQRIQSVECFDRSDTRKKLEKEKMVVGSRMVVVMVVVVVVVWWITDDQIVWIWIHISK